MKPLHERQFPKTPPKDHTGFLDMTMDGTMNTAEEQKYEN